MKTIQLQITCSISTFTNVLVVCILIFKQLLDWLVRFDRRDCMGGVAGWDRRGGRRKGIQKGFVLAKEKWRDVIWRKKEEGERENTG